MTNCDIVQQSEYLDKPDDQDHEHILEWRHPYEYAHKLIYWYNPTNGQVIGPNEARATIPANTPLTTLLEKVEESVTRRHGKKKAVIYIVAGKDGKHRPNRDWFNVYRGWKIEKFLSWRYIEVTYEHNGFTVDLYGTCNFFGNETNLEVMYEALNTLEKKLERIFDAEGYKVLGDTSAQTGRELILISLPKDKQGNSIKYPRLSGRLAEIVYHNLRYQGRVEVLAPKRDVLENGVHILDARFMYASCLAHLPVGPVYHDKVNEFIGTWTSRGLLYPKCPGFYHVTVQVPENWNHIGLIKSGRSRSPLDDTGYYPNKPGMIFSNWITAAEVALLLNNNWPTHINERIVWPETDNITDPLATWLGKLRDFRARTEQEYDKISTLHKDMIRDIVIASTGSFHQYMTYENRVTPLSELPLSVIPFKIIKETDGELFWIEEVPLSEHRQKWTRPEWSATAWGRSRVRVASFALRLPYEDVISIRTDCVLSASKPDWLEAEDKRTPGCFRDKVHATAPWDWPKNIVDVDTYLAKYKIEKQEE